MPRPSARRRAGRRAIGWLAGWIVSAAFYLLLIDTTDLPELLVGAVVASLAATAFELSREQHVSGVLARPAWLARLWRPLASAPGDVLRLCVAAVTQAVRRAPVRGRFRSAPFAAGGDDPVDEGRRALAQALGSFAPNTVVVGVDRDRDVIIAHQLVVGGGAERIDVMRLG